MDQSSPLYTLLHTRTDAPLYIPTDLLQKARQSAPSAPSGKVFSHFRLQQADTAPGVAKPADGLPFGMLRALSDASPIDRVIIDTRIMQMKRVARPALGRDDVGFAVHHVRHNDPDFEVPAGLQDLARDVEAILAYPTAQFHRSIRDFFTCAVEEELVLDRKAMVIARDRKGRPQRYHLLDGETIRPVPSVIFDRMRDVYEASRGETTPNYSDVAYQMSVDSGVDLLDAAHVQIIDGHIVAGWRDSEMSVDITNPSVRLNQWGYGRSLLEKSWRTSDAFLRAWNYNLGLFELNYPEAILAVVGDYDEAGLAAFKRKVLGEGTGVDNSARLPVIPFPDPQDADMRMVKLRDTPKDMLYSEWLQAIVNLKTAAYRMHPSLVNFSHESASGSIVFQTNATERDKIELSQEEGFHSLLQSLGDWLNRTIVQEYHEDLRLVWVNLNRDSEDVQITRAIQELNSYATLNEVRKKRGYTELPTDLPTHIGDLGGSYLQALQTLQQIQQQAAHADDAPQADDAPHADAAPPESLRRSRRVLSIDIEDDT